MQIASSVKVIDAPPARVWALTVDVERWPRITPTVTEVRLLDDPPLAEGSRARLRQPGLGRRTWTVEELEPQRRFVWSTRLLRLRMAGIHELEAVADGRTRQRLSVELDGVGAGLVGRLVRRQVHAALEEENAGFATAATQPPQQPRAVPNEGASD